VGVRRYDFAVGGVEPATDDLFEEVVDGVEVSAHVGAMAGEDDESAPALDQASVIGHPAGQFAECQLGEFRPDAERVAGRQGVRRFDAESSSG